MNWYNNSYRIILHTRFGFKSLTSPAQPVRNPSNTGSHFEFLHETLSFGREKKNDKVSDLARQYVVNHKEEIIEQFAGKKRFITGASGIAGGRTPERSQELYHFRLIQLHGFLVEEIP